MANDQGRVSARLDTIRFEYENPNVSVDAEPITTRHELISGDVVIQKFGKQPDQIRITGVIRDYEAALVDELASKDAVPFRSDRWEGDVIVIGTSTAPMNAKDQEGYFLYEFDIDAIEVDEATTFEEIGELFDTGLSG